MADVNVIALMRERLGEAQAERETVRDQLRRLEEEIKGCEKRLPRRPRENQEQLEQRMVSLEYKRTTTSMSLQDEKQLLREIGDAKKGIKEIDANKVAMDQLNGKRDQRSACLDRIRTLGTALQQLSGGIKRMELAQRLGVATDRLESCTVAVPAEKAGELVGRGGSNLRRFQEECGVTANLDSKPENEMVQLHLEGTPEGLALALERVRRLADTVTQEISVSPAQRSMLVKNRAAMLQELSSVLNVRIDVRGGVRKSSADDGPETDTIIEVTGVPDAIAALQAHLNAPDFAAEDRVDFDVDQVARVVGKGGENMKRLQAEFDVDLNIDRRASQLVIRGPPREVARAHIGVLEMLRGVQDIEEIIPITSSAHISALLGNQGETLRNARTTFEARVDLDRESEDVAAAGVIALLRVRAPLARLGLAAAHLRERLAVCDQELIRLRIPCVAVPAIFGKGGSNIKRLREEHAVIVDYEDPPAGTPAKPRSLRDVLKFKLENAVADDDLLDAFLVHGGTAEGRAAAAAELEDVARRSEIEIFDFCEAELVRRFLGSEGEATRVALDEAGVEEWSAHRDASGSATGSVLLRGTKEALAHGAHALNAFESGNQLSDLALLKEDVAALSSSPVTGRSALMEIQDTTGAKLRLQGGRRAESQDARVSIRGDGPALSLAREAILRELGYRSDADMSAELAADPVLAGRRTAVLPLSEAAVGPLIGQGGSNIKRLLQEFPTVSMDVLHHRRPSVLRLRGAAAGVDAARAHLLKWFTEEVAVHTQNLRFEQSQTLAATDPSFDAFKATQGLAAAFAVVGDLSEGRRGGKGGRGRGGGGGGGGRDKDSQRGGGSESLLLTLRGPAEAVSDAKDALQGLLQNRVTERIMLSAEQGEDMLGDGIAAATTRATLEALAVAQGAELTVVPGVPGVSPPALDLTGPFVEVQKALRLLLQHLEYLSPRTVRVVPVPAEALPMVANSGVAFALQNDLGVDLRRLYPYGLRAVGASTNAHMDMQSTCVVLTSRTTSQPEASRALEAAEAVLQGHLATFRQVTALVEAPQPLAEALFYGRNGRSFMDLRPTLGAVHCFPIGVANGAGDARLTVSFTPLATGDGGEALAGAVAGAVATFEAAVAAVTEARVSLVVPNGQTDDLLATLIGRGGKNIRSLESKHGVRMDLNRVSHVATLRPDPAFIPGASPDGSDEEGGEALAADQSPAARVHAAHEELKARIEQWKAAAEKGGNSGNSGTIESRVVSGLTAMELSAVKGANLEALRKQHGLSVLELKLAARCVRFVGPPDEVNLAELDLLDILAAAEDEAEAALQASQLALTQQEEKARLEEEAREVARQREEQASVAYNLEAVRRKQAEDAEAARFEQQRRLEEKREQRMAEEARARHEVEAAAAARAVPVRAPPGVPVPMAAALPDFGAPVRANGNGVYGTTGGAAGSAALTPVTSNGGGLGAPAAAAGPAGAAPSLEAASLLDSLLADWNV